MTHVATDVEAIIQAAGHGLRLGLGPKAFVVLAGRTLLERAVSPMLAVAARVIVAVPDAEVARASTLFDGSARVRVIAGGERRTETLRKLVAAATAPWLLLHDVVHPGVTPELASRVLAEARRAGAACAMLPNAEFLFGADGNARAAPGELMTMQKPVAFSRKSMLRGFAAEDRAGPVRDLSALQILALGGQAVSFVPGHPMNHKLTNADDLEFLQRLAAGS